MPQAFDLVVLGSGTAASTIAIQCRAAGWRVAVADCRPFGGTCALRGCTPKKVLAFAASAIDTIERMRAKGVTASPAAIEWSSLMRFKRSFTDSTPAQTVAKFNRRGVACYHGAARFIAPRQVAVDANVLQARHIAIATGATPVRLPIEGLEHLTTSDDFLELEEIPERIIFVGGGYIAFEFAHVAARAKAKVTILHRNDKPLKAFDPDMVSLLIERTRRLGVNIHLGHTVTRIKRTAGRLAVCTLSAGRKACFQADLVVHSAGRKPAIDELNLAAGGITVENGRIQLDDRLRSVSNEAVSVAGDAAHQGPPLTPVASLDAQTVVDDLLDKSPTRPDYTGIPSVVFTSPPLARVGLSEHEARARVADLRVRHEATFNWFSVRHTGESCAGFKTLVDGAADRLVGAHLMTPDAHEIVNLLALAMQNDLPASRLRRAALAFPTGGYDMKSML